ncbi:MAG: undecaprenyldiphospho-muramoylpentapeptide beta-N-acetylglucosaminyltransferase [Bacteroidales bacterium]|nr:undecaprenyldiphospho-muramoylpentapeptide beta-N-acetylglucosaminyltransferase [Bacteroidales bacterium]
MHDIKIIISGGGTGGHIFPAIAIANALKKKEKNCEILFIGAKGKMEMEKVPAAGFSIEGLWISGLHRKLTLKNLSFPFKVVASLYKAKKIINKFKPDVVVGVGGYASGPTLRVAAKKGIPTLIQEQNSYPGITNKLLARSVDKICVAYKSMERFFPESKIILTGNPVREEVVQIEGKKEKAIEYFGLTKDKNILLIIGGSQGAKSINESIHHNLQLFVNNNIQLIWQTGKYYFDTAKEAIKEFENSGIKVYEFITRMDYSYSAADIVVSRAGAIAISELCAVKKPVIFIPLPIAAEDHQTKNALALVKNNAALLVKDIDSKDKLGHIIIDLFNNKEKQDELKKNIGQMSFEKAADKIANEILKISGFQ